MGFRSYICGSIRFQPRRFCYEKFRTKHQRVTRVTFKCQSHATWSILNEIFNGFSLTLKKLLQMKKKIIWARDYQRENKPRKLIDGFVLCASKFLNIFIVLILILNFGPNHSLLLCKCWDSMLNCKMSAKHKRCSKKVCAANFFLCLIL